MRKLAIITIGQTPREDITRDLKRYFPKEYLLAEYGVLDGLSRGEILRQYGYSGSGELLISRARDQEPVLLDGERAAEGLQGCIGRAEQDGASLLLLACTGQFPGLRHRVPLIKPGAAERRETIRQARGGAIGVIFPNRDQRAQVREWWTASGATVDLLEPASPYGGAEEAAQAALRLKAAGAKALCMDCFGYSAAQQGAVCRATGLKPVLPREELAKTAMAILNGDADATAAALM